MSPEQEAELEEQRVSLLALVQFHDGLASTGKWVTTILALGSITCFALMTRMASDLNTAGASLWMWSGVSVTLFAILSGSLSLMFAQDSANARATLREWERWREGL